MTPGRAHDGGTAAGEDATSRGIAPALVCPRCGSPLRGDASDDRLSCRRGHGVELVAGIADCRPPLRGFDIEADRRLALELAATPEEDFEALLRRYWRSNGDVPPRLVERHVRGDLIAAERAAEVADQIERETGAPVDVGTAVLEVGSGTAALAAVLAGRAGHVVATDVSLAWLVLARRRIEQLERRNVTLVAATADRLPFERESFDLVVAADVIEHVPDAEAMVQSCFQVLRPGGRLWLSTPNRFSLTPEPHVRLWGVGFLPRPLALRFVRRGRGIDYSDIHTFSAGELRRVLQPTGGAVRVEVPPIAAAVRATYSRFARRLIDVFHAARRTPLVRRGLLAVSPLFHATVVKRPRLG